MALRFADIIGDRSLKSIYLDGREFVAEPGMVYYSDSGYTDYVPESWANAGLQTWSVMPGYRTRLVPPNYVGDKRTFAATTDPYPEFAAALKNSQQQSAASWITKAPIPRSSTRPLAPDASASTASAAPSALSWNYPSAPSMFPTQRPAQQSSKMLGLSGMEWTFVGLGFAGIGGALLYILRKNGRK